MYMVLVDLNAFLSVFCILTPDIWKQPHTSFIGLH